MDGWRREILTADRAFEEVYKALVKGNPSLILNESRTELTQQTYHAVGSESFSNDCSARATTANSTLQILECSHSETLKKKCTYPNTSFPTQSDIAANPDGGNFIGHQSRNVNTKSVIDTSNLKMQHGWTWTKDSTEQDSAIWSLYDFSDDKSNVSDTEPPRLYDCVSDDDGIQSGEGSKNEEVCKKCYSLYDKASKNESALIKDQSVVDPNHWSCNYWMMSNPVRRKSVGPGQKRDFRTLLKYLRAQAQLAQSTRTDTIFRKCSRLHVFLDRNLQSCKNAKQNAHVVRATDLINGEKCSRKRAKLKDKRKRRRSTEQYKEKNKVYDFDLDCNLSAKETFEGQHVEYSESNGKIPKRKIFRRDKDTDEKKPVPNTSAAPIKYHISGCEKNKSSSNIEQNGISKLQRPNSLEGSVSNTTDLFVVEEHSGDPVFSFATESPAEEGSRLDKDGDSDPFPWVGSGHFRELVAQMNSRPSSTVVREYPYL